MKAVTLSLVGVLLLLPLVGEAAKPILNLTDIPVPVRVDGQSLGAEEVRKGIIKACQARGWTPVMDGHGNIHAMINVRGRHTAEIEIPFSADSYSIIYVSSEGLNYDERRQRIHRNYNNWVLKLSGTIGKYLRETAAR